MVLAFSIIGLLVLTLIYFLVRHQASQTEIRALRHQMKSLDSQSRFSLSALTTLASQLQRIYLTRLENLQKHALIGSEDFAIAKFIMNQVEFIVMQCCEKRATIEEALNKTLENSEFSIEQINKYIAKQPSEIRIPWCKNTVGGFISACYNLTSDKVKTKDPRESENSTTS